MSSDGDDVAQAALPDVDPRAANPVRHGLTAGHVLAEEMDAFSEAPESLVNTYEPASHVEQALVARLAHPCVRSDRALRLESAKAKGRRDGLRSLSFLRGFASSALRSGRSGPVGGP
jgi:hypothetical protein